MIWEQVPARGRTGQPPGEPRLPTFLVIGAPKTGTTSLHHYLRAHPQIFMSETKELDFFIAARNWRRGREWYERQFSGAGPAIAVGESSPRYTQHPDSEGVAERIAALIPEARLVYLVRDPLDQMVSHYRDRVRVATERLPLERALREEPVYLATARYAARLEPYLACFPRDRVLVVVSENLRRDRRRTVARILGFLGVDETWESDVLEEERNVGNLLQTPRPAVQRLIRTPLWDVLLPRVPQRVWRAIAPILREPDSTTPTLSPELRRELRASLADDVQQLRHLLGRDFDGWGIA